MNIILILLYPILLNIIFLFLEFSYLEKMNKELKNQNIFLFLELCDRMRKKIDNSHEILIKKFKLNF